MRYIIRSLGADEEYRSELIRENDDGTETIVFLDGMEPEDATLGRDLGRIVDELDRCARIITALRNDVAREKNNVFRLQSRVDALETELATERARHQ